MSESKINVQINTPKINAYTYPSGPKGIGIKEVKQYGNKIQLIFDDESESVFEFPNWWFGTANDYNNLSFTEKQSKELYFILEG